MYKGVKYVDLLNELKIRLLKDMEDEDTRMNS